MKAILSDLIFYLRTYWKINESVSNCVFEISSEIVSNVDQTFFIYFNFPSDIRQKHFE